MIYQPRNVQPSGVSIDGLLDNTFTMEVQTNSYVSAYQLLIVDFDNNEIYTGSKTTLTNYAYNGDILEIPVSASAVALSNGTNYKWRVRLYQPTADILITYGLVQATSTTTTIYLQPNINIKAGMAITINSQTKTISSYNSDTGVAVVSSAFSSAPAVGTQYKIYSDFIETVPDYIVYARRTPAVAISNVPSSLTLKYHTFQGIYTQSDNVPIVYHKFDLYTRNDDGTISLVASSDKVYSANLSYTYDSFRTGNKYLIQMTVENDMGVITTTDMYEFNVSYDIVEYLQQPLASFDDKNNAVKVSWVTPVEHDATSFRSDAATGIIQDNNNTLTQATFEPGQSIGEGDVVQITNSDCTLVIDGKSTQATSTNPVSPSPDYPSEIESVGYENLFNKANANIINCLVNGQNGKIANFDGAKTLYIPIETNTTYTISKILSARFVVGTCSSIPSNGVTCGKCSANNTGISITITSGVNDKYLVVFYYLSSTDTLTEEEILNSIQIEKGSIAHSYIPYGKYGIKVETTGYNLFDKNNRIVKGSYINNSGGITVDSSLFYQDVYIKVKPNTNYTISSANVSIYRIAEYDNNKMFLKRLHNQDASTSYTITTSSTTEYIKLSCNISDLDTIQFVLGTDVKPYDSPQTLLIVLNQPLRSLPNGVKDKLYVQNNKLYVERYVGSVVLDGSEDWVSTSAYTGYSRFVCSFFNTNIISNTGYNTHFTQRTTQEHGGYDYLYIQPNAKYIYIQIINTIVSNLDNFKTWLSTHNTQVDYELVEPYTEEVGDGTIPYINGINYMHISSNMDTTFSLVYPHKTISGNAYDYTEFNPPGVKQTGTVKSYNAITGVGTLMAQYPFTYIPMQGDSYAVISNIYNVSGFSYLYNTPYNTVNSLYTHGYTATWATPDGLCVLPDDFNITLQFSPDGNFFYDQNGVYQEVVNLITTETDDPNNEGEFTIKIDKNKLIFVQNPDISLELPFYTNTTQVFVLSSASVAQINNDYVWDDTATWTDTYTWVEGGTSLERVCNHWWKVQITNTGIKIEEIFPTT